MKRIILYSSLFIVLFAIGFFFAKNNNENLLTKRTQLLMGTLVEIQVKGLNETEADKIITKAFDEIKRIDDLFSSHSDVGAITKINNSGETLFAPHPEIFEVMLYCDSLNKISKGAFDVSLGTLINEWDFGSSDHVLPSEKNISAAKSISGWKNIQINSNASFTKTKGVQLNFGAIAKGYAVDKAIELLKRNGISTALVNAGGEIRELGSDWVVGIQHPRSSTNLLGTLKLNGMAVATSGDYEQYFEINGKRYHHILDPTNGYPSEKCRSVTVIAQTDMEADALATAVFVLGKDEGLNLIERLENTEVMIVDSIGKIFYSTGFEKYLVN
ncbi:MAG: FAD:protein FMN transferase [Ignavibacteriales bacterium]|nr:MAG: FAD:protein FMN transferase [Ignavibacteriales bacterium]